MLRDYNTTYDEKGVGKNWTFYYINQTWYNSSVLKDPVKEYWELVSPLISFSFSVYLFLTWNDYDCCINDAEGSSWISNWSPRSFLSGYIQCIVFVQTRIWFMTDFGWIEFCLNVWMKIKSDWKLVKKKNASDGTEKRGETPFQFNWNESALGVLVTRCQVISTRFFYRFHHMC